MQPTNCDNEQPDHDDNEPYTTQLMEAITKVFTIIQTLHSEANISPDLSAYLQRLKNATMSSNVCSWTTFALSLKNSQKKRDSSSSQASSGKTPSNLGKE